MKRHYCTRCQTLLIEGNDRCYKCGSKEIKMIEINVQSQASKNIKKVI